MTPDEQLVLELLMAAVDKYGPSVLFGALGGLLKQKPELKSEATKALAAAKAESAKGGGGVALLLAALLVGKSKRRR